MAFFLLVHFAEHADFLLKNRYQDENNILFSQIISMVFAGTLFPEFKDAPQWQAEGCRIINEQLENNSYRTECLVTFPYIIT